MHAAELVGPNADFRAELLHRGRPSLAIDLKHPDGAGVVLSLIGRRDQPPTPPLSLIGDFGGGGMLLALGVLSVLFERQFSGRGQVVDAAMVEGAALLATPFFGFAQSGTWNRERGTNLVDSGAPFYDVYETADGRWLSVGALEPHFYADLVELLELPADLPAQYDRTHWLRMKTLVADAVRGRTLQEWLDAAEGRSPCIAPVLDVDEAPRHPHLAERGTFVEIDGIVQPAPAPRFGRTPATVDRHPPLPGEHTTEILTDWGIDSHRIEQWLHSKVVRQNTTEERRGTDESDGSGHLAASARGA